MLSLASVKQGKKARRLPNSRTVRSMVWASWNRHIWKQEIVTSGDAPSAPAVQPAFAKKEEQVEEPAPVDSAIGVVDYDPDDEELEEPAPVEGAAPSAPSSGPPEEEFRPVRRRGTRAGRDERNKSFKRQFHQVGFPSAKRWLRDYTTHACGESFELSHIYLTDTPDFTPVVRFVGQFEEEDANADPILAIARFIRYVPSLKSFLNNRCLGLLLQQVYQRNRELYQEHKDRPFGSNPLDYFERPQRNRGEPIRPDHQGVGAQFHRDLLAGKYPDLVDHQERQAADDTPAVVEEGLPLSGWRPSLRLPVQPKWAASRSSSRSSRTFQPRSSPPFTTWLSSTKLFTSWSSSIRTTTTSSTIRTTSRSTSSSPSWSPSDSSASAWTSAKCKVGAAGKV